MQRCELRNQSRPPTLTIIAPRRFIAIERARRGTIPMYSCCKLTSSCVPCASHRCWLRYFLLRLYYGPVPKSRFHFRSSCPLVGASYAAYRAERARPRRPCLVAQRVSDSGCRAVPVTGFGVCRPRCVLPFASCGNGVDQSLALAVDICRCCASTVLLFRQQ